MIERYIIEVDAEQEKMSIQQMLPVCKEKKIFATSLLLWSILRQYELVFTEPDEEVY